MFGKNKAMNGSGEYSKMESMIGAGTVLQGTIATKGTIRVDGKLEGGITEASHIVIGEEGQVHGDVSARTVVIAGKIVGNVTATTSLEIIGNAEIHGDIKTASLSISEGSTFEGNCTMMKEKEVIEMKVNQRATG